MLNISENICKQCIQRLILKVYAIIDKWLLRDIVEQEQILLDRNRTDWKVDLKMIGWNSDMEDFTLDIKMKSTDALIMKRDMQVANQKSELDNFLILD